MMFEEFVEFIGSQDGAPPKALDPNAPPPSAIIGAGVPRIDGPLKTTGSARYASDYNFPGAGLCGAGARNNRQRGDSEH